MTGEFSSKAMDTGGTFAEIKGLPTYNSIPRENILQQQKGNQDTQIKKNKENLLEMLFKQKKNSKEEMVEHIEGRKENRKNEIYA